MKSGRSLILFGVVALAIAAVVFPYWPQSPREKLPEMAKNIRFSEKSGWQYWDYRLSFDCDPAVATKFAVELMQRHGIDTNRIEESRIDSSKAAQLFGGVFHVAPFTNGVLVSGHNGWINAVVDQDRGRLYYRGFN